MTQKRRMNATKRADALFSAHIRARGVCELESWFPEIKCNGNLQCCHLVSRRYRAVRWNEENALAGCAAHHLYGTHHPLEWEQAAEFQLGESHVRAIKLDALNAPPMDPHAVIERLKETV